MQIDYKAIGFKCGLEIHQRLATGTKLFCSCPNAQEDDREIARIERYQRAVAGELGKMDMSSKFEESKKRKFVYSIPLKSSCLVELDEEPPHEVSSEAVEIALSIAKALNLEVFDELEPMRKEVVDGSDTSAFQRTIMVGMAGSLSVEGVKVDVQMASLEEESSGIIDSKDSTATYDISRLGMPLIEIDTSPGIPNPGAARSIALHIGTILRLTGRVQRGIGSIRQDVNVSIRGGARIEIKGLQDVASMDRFIENEVLRQSELIRISKLLTERNASVGKAMEVTKLFSSTAAQIIARALSNHGRVYGVALHGFEGIMGRELGEGRRLGTEISEYAKMAGVNGIIHGDEDMQKYGITQAELSALRKALSLGKGDSFLLVAANGEKALSAASLAASRAEMAISRVPPETRAAINDERCLTRFMRPLPGGSRMYPETDARPVFITKAMLEKADREKPDIQDIMKNLVKQLGDEELAHRMMLSRNFKLYNTIVERTHSDPQFVANILLQKFTELSREGVKVEDISENAIIDIFREYAEKRVTKQGIAEILRQAPSTASIESIIKEKGLARISGPKLKELISKEFPGIDKELARKKIMSKYRFNIDGAELNELLSRQGH
jgi:glutamyl-tRNA(Gln) amidotransferase subunit E